MNDLGKGILFGLLAAFAAVLIGTFIGDYLKLRDECAQNKCNIAWLEARVNSQYIEGRLDALEKVNSDQYRLIFDIREKTGINRTEEAQRKRSHILGYADVFRAAAEAQR